MDHISFSFATAFGYGAQRPQGDKPENLQQIKSVPGAPSQIAVLPRGELTPLNHMAETLPNNKVLRGLSQASEGLPSKSLSRKLSDGPVVDKALSYYIKPSYWQRIKASVLGQKVNNNAAAQATPNLSQDTSVLVKEIGEDAALLVEGFVEDQRFLEPLTLLFGFIKIVKGAQVIKTSEYLKTLTSDELVNECRKYFDLLMTDVNNEVALTPEMVAIKEHFKRTNQTLIDSLDQFRRDFKDYLSAVEQTAKFDEKTFEEGIPFKEIEGAFTIKSKVCETAKIALEASAKAIDAAIDIQLKQVAKDHDALLKVLNANEAVMGAMTQSAWGSIKRNVASFIASVLGVADVILTGVAYLGVPILSPVAGILSEFSKLFLIPGYKSSLIGSIKESYEAFKLGDRLHAYTDKSDSELMAITESLQRNQNIKTKLFSAGFAVTNTLLLAGSSLLVGATVLAAVGVIGGSALAVLNPVGLTILAASMGATAIFSAYKAVRSVSQYSKRVHWQGVLKDVQKFDPTSPQLKYSQTFLNKMYALVAAKRNDNPQLSSAEAREQAKDELQQKAIRKLIRWDPDFAVHVLMERLRENESPEIVASTKKYLVEDLKALTAYQADILTHATGAAREKAELVLKAKLGVRSSALYRNALPEES